MLDTREAAMTEANDFQDSSEVLLSSEKCDIPLTITHSMFISWAAANRPVIISGKKKQTIIMKNNDPFSIRCEQEPCRAKTVQKKQTNYNMKMILNQSTVNKNPAQLISSEFFSTVS